MNPESVCEAAFSRGGPYWHLYTDGDGMPIFFADPVDFVFGITLLGMSAAEIPRCRIVTFTLMSNHIHVILAGSEADVRAFFSLFRARLQRYLARKKRFWPSERFEASLFRIPDLRALRSEIIYVNRNGYVVSPDCTPFSYWWSAGVYFFNPMAGLLPTASFAELPLRERREMCHSREADLPDHYRVLLCLPLPADRKVGPVLAAPSFCALGEAESFFRDAHQYFRLLGRDQEAQAEVARRLGDKVFLTDDELFGAVCALCAKEYDVSNPVLVPADRKLDLARKMHFDYNASNKQIQRMLRLSPAIVEDLFPSAKPILKNTRN